MKNAVTQLLCLLALVALPSATNAANKPAEKGFEISGVLLSAAGGEPIAGAEVAIGVSQKSDVVAAVTTGSDGRFVFHGIEAGKYWLVAEGRNFSRQGYQQHDNYFTGIAVGPELVSTGLVFKVVPDGRISGTVSDDAGDPVGDARVLLFKTGVEEGKRNTSVRGQTTTDDEGKYRFSHLEPGTYLIAVSGRPWYAQYINLAQGDGIRAERSPLDVAFPITYYSGTTEAEQATPLELHGGDRATADVQLTPVPALHLIVDGLDDSKAGISVSMVQQVMGTALPPVGSQVTALSNGQYEVAGIAPGQYTAVMQTYGKGVSSRQRQIDLSQDAEISTTDATPSAQISGTVTLNGAPFGNGGVVRFTNRDSGSTLQAMIDGKGQFTVNEDTIPPGRYDLGLFNVSDAAVNSVSAVGAKVSGETVEIARGGSAQLAISVSRGLAQIEGTVSRQGRPFSGAMVVLVPEDMQNNIGLLRRDQSDSDGTFALRDVAPGKYTVVALEHGWDMEWRSPGVLDPFLPKGEHLTVTRSAKVQAKVEVQ